jgi:hypothetical protein
LEEALLDRWKMKLWIDDVRPTPEGWDRAYTAPEAIAMLQSRQYTCVSFDHDLGYCEHCSHMQTMCSHNGNGYEVACWLEEQVATDDTFPIPEVMTAHSDNGPGRKRIELAIDSIKRIGARRV